MASCLLQQVRLMGAGCKALSHSYPALWNSTQFPQLLAAWAAEVRGHMFALLVYTCMRHIHGLLQAHVHTQYVRHTCSISLYIDLLAYTCKMLMCVYTHIYKEKIDVCLSLSLLLQGKGCHHLNSALVKQRLLESQLHIIFHHVFLKAFILCVCSSYLW